MDAGTRLGVACGLEAMFKAGLLEGYNAQNPTDPSAWKLHESLRDSTGVIFASSFPAMESTVAEVSRFHQHRLRSVLERVKTSLGDAGGVEAAVGLIQQQLLQVEEEVAVIAGSEDYSFDRKFLFKVSQPKSH